MSTLPFDEVMARCIDDLAAGRRNLEECLAAYPEHRRELQSLLELALTFEELPRVAERPAPAARRAQFMAELRRTPQQSRHLVRLPKLQGIGSLRMMAMRFAVVAAPTAAALAIALVVLVGRGATPASASTLTVFSGGVEQQTGGTWVPIVDGTSLPEGAHIRTTDDARAMVTFPDGSTSTLGSATELVLERIRIDGARQITLDQRAGWLWNDVVPDARSGALYVVRTPDTEAQALGTVFETAIVDGTTSVTTADGLVQVASTETERVQVPEGEVVVVKARRLEDRRKVVTEAELSVQAPFAASLIGPHGAATGARPDGVVFRQLPGVTTTNPGAGPQQIDLARAEPGDYTLVLRRFADGQGNVVIRTTNGDVEIPVGDENEQKVVLRVGSADGQPTLEVVNRANPVTQDRAEAVKERVVTTKRSDTAVPVVKQRAEATAAANRGEATPATKATRVAPANPTRTSTTGRTDNPRSTTEPGRTPTTAAVVTPDLGPDQLRQRLRDALSRDDRDALRRQLTELLRTDSPLSRADRVRILSDVLQDRTAATRLRAFLADENGELGRRLREMIAQDGSADLRQRLGEALAEPSRTPPRATPTGTRSTATPRSEGGSLPRVPVIPTRAPSPGNNNDRQRNIEPSPTPRLLPTATPTQADRRSSLAPASAPRADD